MSTSRFGMSGLAMRSRHSRLRRIVALALALAIAAVVIGGVLALARPFEPLRASIVQSGLDHPWDIAFADGGRMLVTERIGRVNVFAGPDAGAVLLHTATIPGVRAELESGLMGIAVRGEDVFVCASRDSRSGWRVELLHATLAADGSLSRFEPLPVGEITGAARHQGCAVEIDANDHVWFSVGDANLPAGQQPSQDQDRLNGKVLRVNLDGSVPDDNPFGTAVYSIGHRNPQGLAIRADGLILAVEHGTDVNDEINVIMPAANYGYPCFTGADEPGPIPEGCGRASDYVAPAWASGSSTLATSGAAILTGTAWGDWEGDLIVSTLKEEDLRRFSVDADGRLTPEQTLLDRRFGRLRALVIGPDGALYVSTTNGGDDRILRVTR